MRKSKTESASRGLGALKLDAQAFHDVCNQRDTLRDQRDALQLQVSDLEKKLTDTNVKLDKADRDAANALAQITGVIKRKNEDITELRAELRDCYSMLHRLIKAKVAIPF